MVNETPSSTPAGTPGGDAKMPWTSAAAFLAEVVNGGGSGGRILDVREREGGGWDVVLLLDGGYSDRDDAVESMKMYTDYLHRSYVAEVQAGRIEPASDAGLAKIGLERSPQAPPQR